MAEIGCPQNLEKLIIQSVKEVFTSWKLPLEFKSTTTTPEAVDGYVSEIGFHGEEFKGLLRLWCPKSALAATFPLKKKQVTSENEKEVYGDWLRELSNQILGGIKSECRKFSVRIAIGIPYLIQDNHSFLPFTINCRRNFLFEAQGSKIYLGLEAYLDERLDFVQALEEDIADITKNSNEAFFF